MTQDGQDSLVKLLIGHVMPEYVTEHQLQELEQYLKNPDPISLVEDCRVIVDSQKNRKRPFDDISSPPKIGRLPLMGESMHHTLFGGYPQIYHDSITEPATNPPRFKKAENG